MASEIRLFVGNLPASTEVQELVKVFSTYGDVTSLDLKSKPAEEADKKNFAFITLSTEDSKLESCIRHFSNKEFKGNKLYVTRARESFLERLQRERAQTQTTKVVKNDLQYSPKKHPEIKLSEKLNPRKRKVDNLIINDLQMKKGNKKFGNNKSMKVDIPPAEPKVRFELNQKRQDSDQKRMEAMKKKKQDFRDKQHIIKIGLNTIDKAQNSKVIFGDFEPKSILVNKRCNYDMQLNKNFAKRVEKRRSLFNEDEDDDSGSELNFNIKKQYEGKKGQKVLDLQSRYKSDKRFTLDERFIDNGSEDEKEKEQAQSIEQVELGQEDEKAKQLNILQDVLGVSLKTNVEHNNSKKAKPKLGMFRFDPTQPEHSKFLAQVEDKEDLTKKSKKNNKSNLEENKTKDPEQEKPKIEVSKEQFYKVSDTLIEAIVQPTTFSLRSLFANDVALEKDNIEQNADFTPLELKKKAKVKNPFDPGDRNPFVYDSSDSEAEVNELDEKKSEPQVPEVKAVWKENLFFSESDHRLKEGLAFFNKTSQNDSQKERRELKSLMKKRIYNKERKNQMFQKKIGGRKKSIKNNPRRQTIRSKH